jgi:DNA polymerase V
MKQIYDELHLTATAGIGTNLYLCKIALDITAKHVENHIGYLDQETYQKTLWDHLPLTDFWQVSTGTEKRLHQLGIYTMGELAVAKEAPIYKMFGINAEILIDHAKGIEPVTIQDIKAYKSKSNSISQSQILFEDYPLQKARIVVKEMVELMSLDLVDKALVSSNIFLSIGYSKDAHKPTGGSLKLTNNTNVYSEFLPYFLQIFDETTIPDIPIRRIGMGFGSVTSEENEQLDLFTNPEKIKKERTVEQTINSLKHKFGKNAILKGMDLLEGATTKKRNLLIGGHNGGEDENNRSR